MCNVQKTKTEVVDRLMNFYTAVETTEARSVLRTLHALHGFRIREALLAYLESDEAWDLSESAYNELVGEV